MRRLVGSAALLLVLTGGPGCSDDGGPPAAGDSAIAQPDAAPGTPGKIGDPCAKDEDCEFDLCRLKRGTGVFPGGYCSKTCDAITDPCPAGATCVGTVDGDCFKLCATQSECRDGYLCKEAPGGSAPTICFPE